jgi:EAL domain-containing protein (putative c-di-GMP-specific phosphodiesterase class I)
MINRQVRTLKASEVIFREGDVGDCAYLIESGSVLIYLNHDSVEYPLKVLGKGEVFGEMSLIDNSLRSASCRTQEKTQLMVVTREQLLERIQTADPVVRLLMRALLSRLRHNNDSIRGKSTTLESVAHEEDKKAAISQIEQENRIATALKNREFIPWYQPIYDLHTRRILGSEALMRWQTADGLIASPATFIDIMENSALIIEAGHSMLDQCMAHLSQLIAIVPSDFFVSVNISGRQFSEPNFLEDIENLRQKHKIPSHQIKLEVTERVMMEGPQALTSLQNCRALGYKLAIDDFGTGFSSLQYLASMPLHDLKIDRAFITKMLEHEKSLSIVRSLIHMAQLLGMNIIAEGIETQEQWQSLRSLGVNMGQGYLFCKPVPFAEFSQLLNDAKLLKAS